MAIGTNDTARIRNDGKPARASLLGLPKRSLTPPSKLADDDPAPFWTELVQPGPKGFPARTLERREAHGQVVHLTRTAGHCNPPKLQGGPVRLGLFRPRVSPHAAPVPGAAERMRRYRAHEPQLPREPQPPRRSVLQRQLRRAGASS